MASIDLTKAFDLVNRKVLRIVETLHRNMHEVVSFDGATPNLSKSRVESPRLCTRTYTFRNFLLHNSDMRLQKRQGESFSAFQRLREAFQLGLSQGKDKSLKGFNQGNAFR